MAKRKIGGKKPPKMFRPLLWFLNWDEVDREKDKHDIILSAINDGSLVHWRWITNTYGKSTIRKILKKRLASEFHPESLHLARVVFHIPKLRYAR
jgi:hypothetical protein